ncbi:NAD(P)-binding domain-containing protein [Paenibacillus oenotherae]|uniref:NAD(P)-binding domain-containing protein n=1 Tax=Paenibacillus oenotherae TaxID=1435645 RepID=A0ABS7D653_9BACL|nr:NAD(P)-binding domain-containing protein [Paenibacillus oenotherae]MBW7475273.1 NAD(P)-binding domain-containing protein [Paenibacillus oenotherae]
MKTQLPTAIIGGGPVALAAAAQLVKRNMPFVLFERGTHIASSVFSWKHVRMFSPWEFNIDTAAKELLLESGWQAPAKDHIPTGLELVNEYLLPLSQLKQLQPFIHLQSLVKAVYRKGFDKMKSAGRDLAAFIIEYEQNGMLLRKEASAVIDATGTWLTPNPMSTSGHPAEGESHNKNHIHYGIPDILGSAKERYAGKNIVVVGSGHSAIQSLTLLNELKLEIPETTIHWVLRKQKVSDAFGGGENDGLPARGALGTRANQYVQQGNVLVHTPFLIDQLKKESDILSLHGTKLDQPYSIDNIDEVIVATGARPDFSFLSELRYEADTAVESVPQLADLIDPNIHSCGTVRPHGEAELRQPEKDFYIVGSKSYGRAPTFLLATGYEQVRSVVAALAGDFLAAREVQLHLPETGVCSVSRPTEISDTSNSCCTSALNKMHIRPISATSINSGCCSSNHASI